MFDLFRDGPEYVRRKNTPFRPSQVTLAEIHAAVPKHLHQKNTVRALCYVLRDLSCALVVYKLGWCIDSLHDCMLSWGSSSSFAALLKWSFWFAYWVSQSVILAGWFSMAHEAGHGTLSSYRWVNNLIGFCLHTFVLCPYFAWRASHRQHHQAAMSLERDENYIPRTRSQYQLPSELEARLADYNDMFDETPIYILIRMVFMQTFGWYAYLFTNAQGSPRYPQGTNHFSPYSAIFKPSERKGIIASDVGLIVMIAILYKWTQSVGLSYFMKLYLIPYLIMNHWIVMLTYLHHTDPTIPTYRGGQWTFLRGALSTVDRPLLGWAGRFFLHNVSHDHISHHLFSSTPFYNQPLVTEHIKRVLKDDYNYDSTNTFRALYRTFTQCCFIEDTGDIVFFKNKDGEAGRILAKDSINDPSSLTFRPVEKM
ncbi:hypothetical protein D9758_009483 [Tetrapyrgos nigripes]|uniref:Fatty acid desaturase domain-containing protein n=1 Tax=Tetrapyrgos nigripes TaxID=182062 RepID=A0A8H5G163_9AGAR|nr:hypothetical protein D9758_009483 [Tetrapyrgos nigripes]